MIKIPSDAPISVQRAFQDANSDIRDLIKRLDSLPVGASQDDLTDIRKQLAKVAKAPTYQTWEDVFGTFKNPSRVLATYESTTGNIGVAAGHLAQYIAPAGELAVRGSYYQGIFWGQTANNANAKSLLIRLVDGTTNNLLLNASMTVNEAGQWWLEFIIERTSPTSVRTAAWMAEGPSNGPISKSATNITQIAVTLSGQISFRVIGLGTNNNDVTMEGGIVSLRSVDRTLVLLQRDIFQAGGTWTKVAGTSLLRVWAVGGGGNGGAGEVTASNCRGGGGGGGGGYSFKEISAADAGATETVTVGVAGGTSSLGILVTASGGSNGATGASGGAGGPGGAGLTATGATGGNGGTTPTAGGNSTHGGAGGGGGGLGNASPGAGTAGGTGAPTLDGTPAAGTAGASGGGAGGVGGSSTTNFPDGGGGGGGGGGQVTGAANGGNGASGGTWGSGGGGGGGKVTGGAGVAGTGAAGIGGIVVVEQWTNAE